MPCEDMATRRSHGARRPARAAPGSRVVPPVGATSQAAPPGRSPAHPRRRRWSRCASRVESAAAHGEVGVDVEELPGLERPPRRGLVHALAPDHDGALRCGRARLRRTTAAPEARSARCGGGAAGRRHEELLRRRVAERPDGGGFDQDESSGRDVHMGLQPRHRRCRPLRREARAVFAACARREDRPRDEGHAGGVGSAPRRSAADRE